MDRIQEIPILGYNASLVVAGYFHIRWLS